MSGFDLAALFMALIGVAGWANARFLRMPTATAMVFAGLAGAGILSAVATLLPAPNPAVGILNSIGELDFPQTVLSYMLGFLLFAGATQVDLGELRRRTKAIFGLATVGVLASTLIVGFGLFLSSGVLGLDLPLPWAFVFGALISPTDPIAVLAAVKQGSLSKTVEAVLQGEALFNDGVGIVVFSALLVIASGGADLNIGEAMFRVVVEAVGGGVLGAIAAWLVVRAMRTITDSGVEVGLSIALAIGVYSLAHALNVSGPIGVVVAGLLVGEGQKKVAADDHTDGHIRSFWTLVDEVLNALLFLLLGLQVIVVPFEVRLTSLMVIAIVLVTATRFLVVWPAGAWFGIRLQERGTVRLLGWGGLHGALSLAMALSIPQGDERNLILSITFAVVIFSIIVQGLTFAPLARRLTSAQAK
jgi:CPA1 family monovalent cation:H+ antiporter